MSLQGDFVEQGSRGVDMSLFGPPIVRTGTAALNRALFTKTVNLAAAAVHDARLIAQYRQTLRSANEILQVGRISNVCPHPDQALAAQGRKCLLLNPSVKAAGQTGDPFPR